MKLKNFSSIIKFTMLIYVVNLTACASLNPFSNSTKQENTFHSSSNNEALDTHNQPRIIPCQVQKIEPPKWALDSLPKKADDLLFFNTALKELEQHKTYETKLLSAIEFCRTSVSKD